MTIFIYLTIEIREENSLSIPPVSRRKATPMTISQPPTSLVDMTSAADSDEQADTAVSIEGIAQPMPGEQAAAQDIIKDGAAVPVVQPKYDYRQLAHSSWPTSRPGPEITPPPPGQHLLPGRTDQMIYESYDQVGGMQCDPLSAETTQETTGNRPKVYRSERNLP